MNAVFENSLPEQENRSPREKRGTKNKKGDDHYSSQEKEALSEASEEKQEIVYKKGKDYIIKSN